MAKGVIYVLATDTKGLICIGKSETSSFPEKLNELENAKHDGYASLMPIFAIEVEEYDNKMCLIQQIFSKSRVDTSDLYAVDVNIAVQFLSSMEGEVVFPDKGKKETIFIAATERYQASLIPDGEYTFIHKKTSDDKFVIAKARIKDGVWTLLKGSSLGKTESKGIPKGIRLIRDNMKLDKNGNLAEDIELGRTTPRFAATVVLNTAVDGWSMWFDQNKQPVEVYRHKADAVK